MRQYPILSALFILCVTATLSAQSPQEAGQKFIHYLEPEGLVLIEQITPGLTLYQLAGKYSISVADLLSANPDLRPEAIPVGIPVHIPVRREYISFVPPPYGVDSLPVFYRVEPKETLYRIAKVYLGATPEQIIALNPRVKDGLAIGQVLHLGWYIAANHGVTEETQLPLNGGATNEPPTDFTAEYQNEGLTIKEQKGLAIWKPGQMQTHYYVLHATAKPGTYMEVTNPMLHRTVTAKVAGNIPPGIYPAQVGLVVSPSVARALGVLDQQFFARWRFVE